MTKTFSAALIEHLDRTKRKVAEVAETAGVNADALYKLKSGNTRNMGVDDAIKVAHAFGETVEEFMGFDQRQLQSELQETFDQLTQSEQTILLASIKAILDLRRNPSAQQLAGADKDASLPQNSNQEDH